MSDQHPSENPDFTLSTADEAKIGQIARRAWLVFDSERWAWTSGGQKHIPTEGEIALSITRAIEGATETTIAIRSGRLRVDFEHDDESNHLNGVYVSLELGSLFNE
jgi:hypothetical protein